SRLILGSPTAGPGSRVGLAVPSGPDATPALLGYPAPREYRGAAATPARRTGTADLSGPSDVRWARRLLLVLDARPARPVGPPAAAPPRPAPRPGRLAAATPPAPGVPPAGGGPRVPPPPPPGPASRVAVGPAPADDARPALLGPTAMAGDLVTGSAAAPPELLG